MFEDIDDDLDQELGHLTLGMVEAIRVNMMAWKLFDPTVNRFTSGNPLDKPRFVHCQCKTY